MVGTVEAEVDFFQIVDGYRHRWSEVTSHLPEDFNPHHRQFLRDYFRAQVRIAAGQKVRAAEIFNGLTKKTGYTDFENSERHLLAAIDLMVRGENRWGVEPAWEVKSNRPLKSFLPKPRRNS